MPLTWGAVRGEELATALSLRMAKMLPLDRLDDVPLGLDADREYP